MAFATRGLRVLCKIYNGTSRVSYSTFRTPVHRASLVRLTQKFYCTNKPTDKTNLAENLTNIKASTGTAASLMQERLEAAKKTKEEEAEREKAENTSRAIKFSFAFLLAIFGLGGAYIVYVVGTPEYDEQGNVIEDEFSHLPLPERVYKRLVKTFNFYVKYVQEPSRDKLLPDPVKYPYIQPTYTLVLEMTDLLVHPDWTYETGWRWKKRPGVDKFLEAVAPPQFEIVVYTPETGMTVFPILDVLDPKGYIMYKLVRDSTRFVDGHHIKDLSCLNRDLSKVIMVDWDGVSAKFHPDNTLKIPRWTGNDDDTALADLAAFLQTILVTNVEDVRDVLRHYKQFDNPLEVFRENQKKLYLLEAEEQSRMQQKGPMSKWKGSFNRKP